MAVALPGGEVKRALFVLVLLSMGLAACERLVDLTPSPDASSDPDGGGGTDGGTDGGPGTDGGQTPADAL